MRYVCTAITAARDHLKPVESPHPGWRYVCFTDGAGHPDWEVRPATTRFPTAVRNARHHKLRPDMHLGDAEISLWIDGNFTVTCDLDELVDKYLSEHDLAFHPHPQRDCVYAEALACIELGKDEPATIACQVLRYAADGLPAHAGLVATGVVLRRHTRGVTRFNRVWAQEVETGSARDQLAVTYALRETGIQYALFESDLWGGPLFRYERHPR